MQGGNMDQSEIIKDLLNAYLKAAAQITNEAYATIALETILKSYAGNYKFLKNIIVKPRVEVKINDIDQSELNNCLATIIHAMKDPFKGSTIMDFSSLINGYMREESRKYFDNVGISIC
jgi:hypothetical protein